MKLILATTLALALASCRPPDGCTPTTTRCVGQVAELCDADENYQELMDCDEVSAQSGAPFVCGWVDEETADGHVRGHTCVPASAAGGAGGAP